MATHYLELRVRRTSSCTGCGLFHKGDGHARQVEHFTGNGAEKQVPERPHSAGAHNDRVALQSSCRPHDRLRYVTDDGVRPACYVRRARADGGLLKNSTGAQFHLFYMIASGHIRGHHAVVIERRFDGEQVYRDGIFSVFNRIIYRAHRIPRPVHGQQYVDHMAPLYVSCRRYYSPRLTESKEALIPAPGDRVHNYILLFLGVICAAAGGEFFVRGSVGIARAARISPAIIGATVAAFATSSPEFAVGIVAAAAQEPGIALGNALGANVLNVALILGIALAISPIRAPRSSVHRDFPIALAVPVATGLLCLDGTLSRTDGVIMLGLFIMWFIAVLREARRQRKTSQTGETVSGWRAAAYAALGVVLLLGAGELIVTGARGIASSFGISEFVIGATIVAAGTTVPELMTVIIAKWRGHAELGLGTILGSNIFNGLWIVPVTAIIYPIDIEWFKVAGTLIFGVVTMIAAFPPRRGVIGRPRGMLLLLLYLFYIGAIFVL